MSKSDKFTYIFAVAAFCAVFFLIWQKNYAIAPVPEGGTGLAAFEAVSSSPAFESVRPAEGQAEPFGESAVYTDKSGRFSFECPAGWEESGTKGYGEKVEFLECARMFFGPDGFEDGIAVNFGFVPAEVYNNYESDEGVKESELKIGEVRNEENAQPYSSNSFSGWVSMKNAEHTLSIVAFREAEGGYYEARVEAAGGVRTDAYFRTVADSIIASFKETEKDQNNEDQTNAEQP